MLAGSFVGFIVYAAVVLVEILASRTIITSLRDRSAGALCCSIWPSENRSDG